LAACKIAVFYRKSSIVDELAEFLMRQADAFAVAAQRSDLDNMFLRTFNEVNITASNHSIACGYFEF
jgi:hypothetical protein